MPNVEVVVNKPALTVVNIDQAWLAGKTAPYSLSQTKTRYVLQQDISVPGAAFIINNNDIEIDLNNKVVTYDQVGGGVPNSGFEIAGATPDKPASWDLSLAPAATRESTFSYPLVGSFYLKIKTSTDKTPQTIVSDWTNLPANQACRAHFVRSDAFWRYKITIRLEVEHETLGIIAGFQSTSEVAANFKSSTVPGRYRVKLTYIPEQPVTWTPNTEYWLGDLVKPSVDNGCFYHLESFGAVKTGLSGLNQPTWNTQLGSITLDGNVAWMAVATGSTINPSTWQANKAYGLTQLVRPIVATGVIYEAVRIKCGAISGATEPNWIKPPGSLNTPDGTLSWYQSPPTDIHIDNVDVLPTGIYGFYGFGKKNITIKNGRIQQGAGRGFASHAIYSSSFQNLIHEDLDIETVGLESLAIQSTYSTNVDVIGNRVETKGNYKFNRHQLSAAVSIFNSDNTYVARNVIKGGEQWGGIFVNGNTGIIEDNDVHTTSVITNHYGISAYGNNWLVVHNNVVADPGQCMRVDGGSNIMEDNYLTIKSVAPNWDIGRFSLDAIRINDYWNGTAINNIVRNNKITIYGVNSLLYERKAQVVNGICNVTAGAGNIYANNTVIAIKVDPEVVVSGIMPGSKDILVTWQDNVIISDQYCVMFGAYPTYSMNTRFENTTFVKGPNAKSDFTILYYDPKVSTEAVKNTKFVDTKVMGGGTLDKIVAAWNPPTTHRVNNKATIRVNTPDGTPMANTPVVVKDRFGTTVFSGLTDNTGLVPLEFTQYEVAYKLTNPKYTKTVYTPYSVEVTSGAEVTVISSDSFLAPPA
jgi:hypothetical protein